MPFFYSTLVCIYFALLFLGKRCCLLPAYVRLNDAYLAPRSMTPPVDNATNTRSKKEGPKAFSTSRSFCREALAAAVACSRTLIGRAGAPIVAEKPRWFLGEFVVKMASPMLLGDAVKALRVASSAAPSDEPSDGQLQGPGGEDRERARDALREVVLPGSVERLAKVKKL